jgi:hypothetical protein
MLAMFGGSGLMAGGAALAGMSHGPWCPRRRWPRPAFPVLLGALGFMASNPACSTARRAWPAHTTAIVMLSEVLFASLSSAALGAAELTPRVLLGGAPDRGWPRCWSAMVRTKRIGRQNRLRHRAQPGDTHERMTTVYDFEAKQIDGKTCRCPPSGQGLLIVNTASACGFTPQFAGLEELHKQLRPARAWRCWAFPATSSARRTPAATTRSPSSARNYGVSFPMMSKIDVNGPAARCTSG